MVNILTADQRQVIRQIVVRLLRADPALAAELGEIGEARDGVEAVSRVRAEPWDVVLLDISLPHWGGGRALDRILAARPDLPVIMLSDYTYPSAVGWCLEHGAAGFMATAALPVDLAAGVRAALAGRTYVGVGLAI